MSNRWEELLGKQIKEIAKDEQSHLSNQKKIEIYNNIIREVEEKEESNLKLSLLDKIIRNPFKYAVMAAGLQTIGAYVLFQNIYIDFLTRLIGGI